jgi:hypothetical protein
MKLSRRKRITFSLIGAGLAFLALELLTPPLYSLVLGTPFDHPALEAELRDRISTFAPDEANNLNIAPSSLANDRLVLHPYTGYTFNFDGLPQETQPYLGNSIASVQRGPDRLVVAVFGGSVAGGTFGANQQDFAERLEQPTGRTVSMVNFAVGGYKQPQQLMALSYLYSLGAEFDIVINIDGFNEAALTPTDNWEKGVFPFFPRHWHTRLEGLANADSLLDLAEIRKSEINRGRLAVFFQRTGLTRSRTLLIIWKVGDLGYARSIFQLTEALAQTDLHYQVSGPQVNLESEAELFEAIAFVWASSSIQMQRLSEANGAQYFHFLQPNQYWEGSKPLTEAERQLAFWEESPSRNGVLKGYGPLIAAGADLRAEGLNFYDLTPIFAENTETLYIDNCCHFNEAGYSLLGEAVLAAIFEDWTAP